ncbi:hypothetical protein C8F01DRAFT_1157659 [Mycena amicta]|nr:hypothetical protein C8F01DRAFT_1157659 [Mycena amicta]
MPLSLSLGRYSSQRKVRPSPLYLLTWSSLALSGIVFVSGILDLGLWMALSAALVTILYHTAVLIISSRSPELPRAHILTSVSTAGCAAILVFAWIAGFSMTVLALIVGRDNFPGPAPLITMAFPVHVMLCVLTGVELVVMVVVARLSGHMLSWLRPPSSVFQRRLSIRPANTRRLLSA